jgi:hypothetical protein
MSGNPLRMDLAENLHTFMYFEVLIADQCLNGPQSANSTP